MCFSGKIRYYTVPPEDDQNRIHISSEIVSKIAKEFDIDTFETMETEVLNEIEKDSKKDTTIKPFIMDSLGPVVEEKMDEDEKDDNLVIISLFYFKSVVMNVFAFFFLF